MNIDLQRAWKTFVPEATRRALFHARKRSAKRLGIERPAGAQHDNVPQEVNNMISVVVPVYGVEQYLEACVNSLLTQNYKNIEIVLVDDGSPDKCGEMCDAYADAHPNLVKVLHQPNGGLSNARNNGLKVASGQYVMFVDSDDVLPRDALQNLIRGLSAYGGAEIATGNVKRFKGSREWQAWNQMYSHAYSHTWDGERAAKASELVTLDQAPELLFDTTAWNKLFNRKFLLESKVRFPVGKLYEDMLPMAQLFIKARGVVKVPSVVYMYREREDNSSITQKRGQVRNLADKMEMVGRIERELINAGARADQLDTLYFKVLEGDLAVYSPYLGNDSEFDQLYLSELRRYWSLSSHTAKLALALDRRMLYVTQLFSDNPIEGESAAAWVSVNFHQLPLVFRDGVLSVDDAYDSKRLGILASNNLLDMGKYVNLKQVVTDAYISEDRIHIEGFAFLDHIPTNVDQELSLTLVGPEGPVIDLPYKLAADLRANGYWGSGNADRSKNAFVVDIAIRDIEEVFLQAARVDAEFELEINVRAGSYARGTLATGYWRGGRIRRGEVGQTSNGGIVQLPWQPWGKPLRLRISRPKFLLENFDERDGHVVVRFRADSECQIKSVVAVRSWDNYKIQMQSVNNLVSDACEFSANVNAAPRRRNAGGNSNVWRFEVTYDGALQSESIKISPEASSKIALENAWTPRTNSDGTALWHDEIVLLKINSIESTSIGYILTGTGKLEDNVSFTAEMWSDRGAVHRTTSIRKTGSESFEIEVNCLKGTRGTKVVWEPGEYRFRLYESGSSNTDYRIRAGNYLLDSLPLEDAKQMYNGRWHVISDTWELALGIGAPLEDFERGRYNDLRMRSEWSQKSDSEVTPIEAVVFSADMGSSVADSQLAIFEEMRSRHLEFEYRWAVTDYSVEVPYGANPLLRGSEEWFRYLSCSRMIVNNYGGIAGYGNREFQYYLQTWHGTPLKFVGDSEFRSHPREYARRSLVAQSEAQEWDWFISPNPFMSELIPQEFYFPGKIIESGYPRNDVLANSTDESKVDYKSRLGIDVDKKVLLYAPTFRDVSANGFRSPLTSTLDLDGVVKSLGDDWVVVLRGHSFNARNDDKNRSSPSIVDATKYPNVNDLILASDLLVTDYSSIMFDYLVTGRPIVYYVPDLAEYLANRGMYHDFEDVVVGELAHSQDELVELARLALDPATVATHASAYARQRERFVPWDDGGSAARVVDRVLLDIEGGYKR